MQFVSMISTMAGRGKTNAAVHHTEGHCIKQIFMFMNILMTQHQMPEEEEEGEERPREDPKLAFIQH